MSEKTPNQTQNKPSFEKVYQKIKSPAQAKIESLKWRNRGESVVVIDVVCDILHKKHFEYFHEVSRLADRMIVRMVEKTKKHKDGSIVSYQNRAEALAHSPYIDTITSMQDGDNLDWISEYKPTTIVKSTTSGAKVINQINDLQGLKLDYEPKIIVMDHDCLFVPLDQAEAQGQYFDENKHSFGGISSTAIKKTIIDRDRLDNQEFLQCDISQILRNNI